MKINLYIVRHGKVNTDEKNKSDYLHLSGGGTAFAAFLDTYFTKTYFDHIFYQASDADGSGTYNACRNTVRGLKGVKSEFDKAHISMVFEQLNDEGSGVRNVMLCFRSDGFNVISNIINPGSEEQFNKDYHRVFHYEFNSNNYSFVSKVNAYELH